MTVLDSSPVPVEMPGVSEAATAEVEAVEDNSANVVVSSPVSVEIPDVGEGLDEAATVVLPRREIVTVSDSTTVLVVTP